jgi:hypothetical protein
MARKAASNSSGPLAASICSSRPDARAAASLCELEHLERVVGRIPEHRDAGVARSEIPQELQLLSYDLGRHVGRPRDVAAGPRQGGSDPDADGIGDAGHDDRNRGCRRLRGDGRLGGLRYDHLDLQIEQLRNESGQLVEASVRPPEVDTDVLALHVPEVFQPL